MGARTFVYLVCWLILAFGILFDSERTPMYLMALPLAWVLDGAIGFFGKPRSRTTILFRFLNGIPFLPSLVFTPMLMPSFAEHNRAEAETIIRELLGPDMPIAETWFSRGKNFVGRPEEYFRVRFPKEARENVRKVLHTKCKAKPAGFAFPPRDIQTWFMTWDPPMESDEPYFCSGYDVDFGTSGDSLIIYNLWAPVPPTQVH